jgi:competence protein ComEC
LSVNRDRLLGVGLIVVAAGALATGWKLGSLPDETARLALLAVGQGDCAVLQDGTHAILIDAAPTEGAARLTVIPALRSMGVSSVDAIFLSHPDEDHIAGVEVLRQRFPRVKLVMSAGFRHNKAFLGHLAAWQIDPDAVTWLPARTKARLGRFSLDILCPEVTASTPDNDGSMVVKISSGQATAVFSGDGSAEEEVQVAAEGDWSAEVMHAGHHGSRTSTSFTWLGEVHPRYVVISCGRENRYGHPHAETLARIALAKAKVLRTDQDGTVTFTVVDGRFVPKQ